MRLISITIIFLLLENYCFAEKWQQGADYEMKVDFDSQNNQFSGSQKLTYHNNSPDTLYKVFYHLYFNAFQPGSMMDVRSRTIADPDSRVKDRIYTLKENEIGYLEISNLMVDGKENDFVVSGTILEVTLKRPIPPESTVVLSLNFNGQVPIQIRRSGRDNKEGISYSMAQWYPKMAEYDKEGWHADPYVGREFYGVWGNFDVTISMNPNFMVAATGILQNPEEIGFGYEKPGMKVNRPKGKLNWHFKAERVHDFVWAADPDYIHDVVKTDFGLELHFFYQNDTAIIKNWKALPPITIKAFQFMNETFGKYPYPQFSIIQGGDGGMEYPMATLVVGNGSLRGLIGVTTHELIHSWFFGVLANNESLYPWMDEGFTNYATTMTLDKILESNSDNPFARSYARYFSLVEGGKEEPLSTHSDHYDENRSYGSGAYQKGAVLLGQLDYILGHQVFLRGMKRYFATWKFKHPDQVDFMRSLEKEAKLELNWYFEYFINSTKTIDYGIQNVISVSENKTEIGLSKIGKMPMPLDIIVEYIDGSKELYYIPLEIMRGEKEIEFSSIPRILLPDWPWTNPQYTFSIPKGAKTIKSIEIDPSMRMADISRSNNRIEIDAMLDENLSKKN